ncbi:TetR/AcrR family transcriptional regulator [Arthrobacter sp. SA17]
MGRTREYDEDKVLAGAMGAFRQHGYARVSVKNLEDATGLKAGSIYNSFSSKDGLFEASFRHYNRVVLAGRIETHAPAAQGLEGLRRLFISLLHEPDNESFGCLITNSAVELEPGDQARHLVEDGLSTLLALFRDRLTGAKVAGGLLPHADPGREALRLLALYQGVLVLVRTGWDHPAPGSHGQRCVRPIGKESE